MKKMIDAKGNKKKAELLNKVLHRLGQVGGEAAQLRFGRIPFTSSLNVPGSLTVATGGSYRKAPFIGDERMDLLSAKVGKTGRLIFVFKTPETPGHVEILEEDMPKYLPGIMSSLNAFFQQHEDDMIDEARAEGLRKEDEAHAEALRLIHKNDERFGSW